MSEKDRTTEEPRYVQIGVSPSVAEELTKMKEKKEKELGIELSWNKFFTIFLKGLREGK